MNEPSDGPVSPDPLLAHAGWVRRLARALVADPGQADDVEQQAWATALERPPANPSHLRGWWFEVVRNVARKLGRDEARRRRLDATITPPRDEPSTVDAVARAQIHRRLVDAVLALDEPSRTALLLRFFDELPPRDVAARTGVPVETARTRIKRGLEQLRVQLAAELGPEGAPDGRDWRRALVTFSMGAIVTSAKTKLALVAAVALIVAIGATATWRLAQPATRSDRDLIVARAAETSPVERADLSTVVPAQATAPEVVRTVIDVPPAPIRPDVVQGRLVTSSGDSARIAQSLDPNGMQIVTARRPLLERAHGVPPDMIRTVGTLDRADDRFEIAIDDEDGTIALVARGTRLGSIERDATTKQFPDPATIVVDLELVPSHPAIGVVHFHVQTAEVGTPLDSVTPELWLNDEQCHDWMRHPPGTGTMTPRKLEAGNLTIDGLPLGNYRLGAAAPGFIADADVLSLTPEAPEQEVTLSLVRADAMIHGSVRTDDGSPLASFNMVRLYELGDAGWTPVPIGTSLRPEETTFLLSDVKRGRYVVVACVEGRAPTWCDVDATSGDATVELVVPAGFMVRFEARSDAPLPDDHCALQLRVVDEHDRPIVDGMHPRVWLKTGGRSWATWLLNGRYTATLAMADHEPATVPFDVAGAMTVEVPMKRRAR